MKTLALRELRLDFEHHNTRFMTLNGMEQGSAHQLLDVEHRAIIIAALEQFLHPIQSAEFLDLMALPVRDLWTSLGAKFSRGGVD
jgi:hypothetical protein